MNTFCVEIGVLQTFLNFLNVRGDLFNLFYPRGYKSAVEAMTSARNLKRDTSANPEIKSILEAAPETLITNNLNEMRNKLEQLKQRMRRKASYVVGYRKHQLENSWVPPEVHGVVNGTEIDFLKF